MSEEVGQFNAMQASLLEVISVAEYTATKGVTLVTLILTYSAIDTLGWLGAKRDEKKVSPRFKKWVEQYMLPAAPRLTCTAEELYAARCAVLHTMTADSDLHRRKQLRRLFYAWGPSRPEDLQARIDQSRARGTGVVVHLQDLTEGLRLGAAQMFEDALNDDELRARIASKQGRFFAPYSLADFGGDRGGEQ